MSLFSEERIKTIFFSRQVETINLTKWRQSAKFNSWKGMGTIWLSLTLLRAVYKKNSRSRNPRIWVRVESKFGASKVSQ